MPRQNLKIIGNRETHPLTWLPKLNYIALNYIAKNNGPKKKKKKKKIAKNIVPKNYIFKYPTTKILFVIKKIGDATLPNNFKNCLIHPQ